MHGVDAKGQRIIPDPGTKQIANAIIGLKEKEAAGEFTPRGQVDALHETLGRDQYGRVRGVGGVRLGVRKVYGDQYTSTSRSTTSSVNSSPSIDVEAMKAELREELRAEMTQNFNAILAQMGLPTFGAFTQGNVPYAACSYAASSTTGVNGNCLISQQLLFLNMLFHRLTLNRVFF
ncbi:uncharacterized protein LOC130591948 [Beta vulgaris subsp. vulgaris]|uniref:uncharacterized protein LOC130591948 n=1 Tax=Beta vulgaris subsp. vulgaris TaxID=3555 RepID=UPI002547FF1F|nr:uncharacterized protein LOC130591948 [Beta vulgaris subsp. vulgaris]